MATLDKATLEELWYEMPKPLLVTMNKIHVSGQPDGDVCFMRGVYVGPGTDVGYGGSGEGSFYMNDAGDLRIPSSAEALRARLDGVAARLDIDKIELAIAERGPLYREEDGVVHRGGITEEGPWGLCGFNDEPLYLDPVNEWFLLLAHDVGSWGPSFEDTEALRIALLQTLWTDDGMEVPWSHVDDAQRIELCRLLLESEVDQSEKFLKFTEFLKGLLWPNFWGELETYSWQRIESMLESM